MDSFNITRVLHNGEDHISFIECELVATPTITAQELLNQCIKEAKQTWQR